MQLIRNDATSAEVQLTLDELRLLFQALSEALKEPSIKASKEEVSALRQALGQVIDKIDEPKTLDTETTPMVEDS